MIKSPLLYELSSSAPFEVRENIENTSTCSEWHLSMTHNQGNMLSARRHIVISAPSVLSVVKKYENYS
jgi:hypothetical protein